MARNTLAGKGTKKAKVLNIMQKIVRHVKKNKLTIKNITQPLNVKNIEQN